MKQRIKITHIAGFLILIYSVGIAGLLWDRSRPVFVSLVPLIILINCALLLYYHQPKHRNHLLIFTTIFLGGFAVEAIGVNTGLIFGEYTYSGVLGWGIFDTPLLIGLNWAMMVYLGWIIFDRVNISGWIKVLAASAMLVIYDIVLESFAIHYGLWKWESGDPPLQNYAGWFFVSLAFFTLVWKSGIKMQNRLVPFLFVIQFVFFCILYLINY